MTHAKLTTALANARQALMEARAEVAPHLARLNAAGSNDGGQSAAQLLVNCALSSVRSAKAALSSFENNSK